MKQKTFQLSDKILATINSKSVCFSYKETLSVENLRVFTFTNVKLLKIIKQIFSLNLKEINWDKISVGTPFTAYIEGVPVTGKIQKYSKKIYLCQNIKNGVSCEDKLGYKYSWQIGYGSPMELICSNILVTFISFTKTSKKELSKLLNFSEIFQRFSILFASKFVQIGCQKILHKDIKKLAKLI